jgi:uncharacterized membrane protein (DUF4010 family)
MLPGMQLALVVQIAYAFGVGLLIGLERSMGGIAPEVPQAGSPVAEGGPPADGADDASEGPEHLGVRTFSALSLVGFTLALASERMPGFAAAAGAGLLGLIVVMYIRTSTTSLGITTEVAAVAAVGLGALCRSDAQAAGVLALLLTVILASKRFTWSTVRKLRRVELTDTLKFLVVIMIALPMLPNRALDPLGVFNPYKVGFLVILTSGIGFVGYFLTRILGTQRGLGLTGVLGGLTSSTAVTAAMSAQAKESPALTAICAFSTVAANATSFARVLLVVTVLDSQLARRLVWSVGGMALTGICASVLLWVLAAKARPGDGQSEVNHKNPFSVAPALKFAVFFVGILFVAKLAKLYLGDQGVYLAAAVSGLADVDAITMSICEQTQDGSLVRKVGAIGITIAVVSNSVVKSTMAFTVGGARFGRIVGGCLGLATLVGLSVAFLVPA